MEAVKTTTIQEAFAGLASKTAEVRELRERGKWVRARWGIDTVDAAVGGLLPGINLLVGPTKIGKTTVAMNVVKANSSLGMKVAVWSSEMSDGQLAGLAASIVANIPRTKWRDYEATDGDILIAANALRETGMGNTIIVKSRDPRAVLAWCQKEKPDLLVVDYLQFIARSMGVRLNEAIESIGRVVHQIASALEMPVLLLSAQNADGGVFYSTLAEYDAVMTAKLGWPDNSDADDYADEPGDPVMFEVASAREGSTPEVVLIINRMTGVIAKAMGVAEKSVDISNAAHQEIPF